MSYKIHIQPQQQQFMTKIITTFYKYLTDIKNIDDLQGELNYQSQTLNKIYIHDTMIETLKQQIKQFSHNSYSIIKESINNNITPYLQMYFTPFKFTLLQFNSKSLISYHSILSLIETDIKQCEKYLIFQLTIFDINFKDMKLEILTRMRKQHRSILRKIQKEVSNEIDRQYDLFNQCRKKLSQQVKDQIEYIECRRFINKQCQQLLQSSYYHFKTIDTYFLFFQSHFYQYSFDLYIKHTQIIRQQNQLKNIIDSKLKQLMDIEVKLIEQINQQRDTLSIDIDQIKDSIIKIIDFSEIQHLPRYYVQTNKCYFKLQEIKNLLNNINTRQGLLKQQPSTFKTIQDMYKQLLPYYQLHQSIHQVLTIDSQWKSKPILQLSYSHIHTTLITNLNLLQKVSKLLMQQKNSSALSFSDLAINIINKTLSSLWIVQHLTKQAMLKKPNILKQTLNHIFQNQQYNLNQLTITEILKQNLTQQKKTFIIQKSLIAQKVYNQQKLLQQTVNNTKTFQILFIQHKKKKKNIQKENRLFYVEKNKIVYLISCLKEQKQTVYVIEGNQVAYMIVKKISYVLNKLNIIQSTLQNILTFQQLLFKLRNIFRNAQILNIMKNQQMKKYDLVIKMWQKIVDVFIKQPQLWQSIDSQSHKNKLNQGINTFNQILSYIQSIVDDKIRHFPKLYFVPKHKLYQLLQYQSQQQLPAQILQILYGQGFVRLIYEKDNQSQIMRIKGVEGQMGQCYSFKRPIDSSKILWSKYDQIDQQINTLIRQLLNNIILKVNNTKQFTNFMQHKQDQKYLISQILQQNLRWTQMMENLIYGQNTKRDKLKQFILQKYNNIQIEINNKATRLQHNRNLFKIENNLHLRDMSLKLINIQQSKIEQNWKLLPKYKIMNPTQLHSKHHKICLSTYSLINQQQLFLQFGTQLPNYSVYPLYEFMCLYQMQQSFVQYCIARQLEFKVPIIQRSHLSVYKKLIQHTFNHFVQTQISQHLNIDFNSNLRSNSFITSNTTQLYLKHNLTDCLQNNLTDCLQNNLTDCLQDLLTDCLQHVLTGFILSQSYGVIHFIHSNNFQHNIQMKLQIIKFYAYTLQKVMQQIEQKSFGIKIWQLDLKVNKNYRLNLSICSESIRLNPNQNIVESRLLHFRTRQINFCLPQLNLISVKMIQSYAYMMGLQQDDKQQLIKVSQKLVYLLKQLKLSSSRLIKFFNQLINQNNQIIYENNELINQNNQIKVKNFICQMLRKVKSSTNISRQSFVELKQLIFQHFGKKYQLYKKQQDIGQFQNIYNQLYEHLLLIEYNQIRQFSFQKWQRLNEEGDLSEQLNIIDKQQFNLIKQKYLQRFMTNKIGKIQLNYLNEQQIKTQPVQQVKQIKTKIVISGRSILSNKTTTIIKLLKQINQLSLSNFLTQIQSICSCIKQKQSTVSLSNILCNYSNQTVIPSTQCILSPNDLMQCILSSNNSNKCNSNNSITFNSNNSNKCNKWHLLEQTYNSIHNHLFYTRNKIIFQTKNNSISNFITPNIIHNLLFINFPNPNHTKIQIISFQFNKLHNKVNQNIIDQAIKIVTTLCNKGSKILQKVFQLNFILSLQNYIYFIQIFSTQIQPNTKINQIKQFLLMLLFWAIYPLIQIDFNLIKAQHFDTQFNKPLQQIYNWYYSLHKKTWIQWVTFTDFIDQHQFNTTIVDNKNIFIPVNQSVSFMYFLKKVSSHKNCLVLSGNNQLKRSFLTNLILSKTDSIKTYLYRQSSINKVQKMLQKQVSKLTVTGDFIPIKNRSLRFIIQDINLQSYSTQQNNQFYKQYLLALLHKNYDLNRKAFVKNVNFVASLSHSQKFKDKSSSEKQRNEDIQQTIMKETVIIKLREYLDESMKYIYRSYLQQFFGSTQNPYSKQVRQMSSLIIYEAIELKNKMKLQTYSDKMIQKLDGVFLSLKRSTPKVIKTNQDILSLFNYQMKRQYTDLQIEMYYSIGNDGQCNRFSQIFNNRFSHMFNTVLNQMIQKLFFNEQLQQHREQLGLQSFDMQKIQNTRNFLPLMKINKTNKDNKDNRKRQNKFQNQQTIFSQINIPQNSVQYKQLYRSYEKGVQYLSQIIQKNLQSTQKESQLCLFLDKQLISDSIKLMRVYTSQNNHALIMGQSINSIKKLFIMATKVYFNHFITLNIIQLHQKISIKPQIIKLLKMKFKQYLKQSTNKQAKIPILIIIPQLVSQITFNDIELLCQYLQTGQFLSILINDTQKSHNLMKQLKVKSLESQKYYKFKQFCQSKIHFIFGFKKCQQNITIFQIFNALSKRININLQMSSISKQSQIQLSIKSTMSFNKMTQFQYLLPYRLFKKYQQFEQKSNRKTFFSDGNLYPRFCQIIHKNLQQTSSKIKQNILIRKQTINNINQIFQFKKYLERKLQRLKIKQIQMKNQHQQKQLTKNQLLKVQIQKYQIFSHQLVVYETQLKKCDQLKAIVDQETSKVGPILQKAQLVLQKVTRDDINQLRSFPNPPLPASKVCESLIFLFDEVHLIKEKVLQNGQKIKDFWQYAKKFILNDKLVKRISDINQQTIKNINCQVIETVREITSKPQLSQQRVFKASGAAGNLSLFIRAVISTYDVIQMIQPKKKQLLEAQILCQQIRKEMEFKKQVYLKAEQKVNKQNQLIQKSLQEISKITQEIQSVTQQINNIQSLISHLNKYKQVWTQEITYLQNQQLKKMFYYSIWSAFQQICLLFYTQDQIIQFASQFIKQSEEIQIGFQDFLKNMVLKDDQVPLESKIQVNSIIKLRQFKNLMNIVQNFTSFQIPYSQNGFYLNKIISIFDSLKIFSKQDVKTYWLVDQTLTFKSIFRDLSQFNNSNLSQLFNIKVVQIFDCLKYQTFDEYLRQNEKIDMQRNYQMEQYSDEQSQQEQEQIVNQKDQQSQNMSLKSIVIIKNFQHSTKYMQQNLNRLLNFIHSEGKIVFFMTDFDNVSLQKSLNEVDLKMKIDLSQKVFIDLLINKMNFLKLNNISFYKTVNQIKRIKDHQNKVLNKLRNQNTNKDNQLKSIESLLQNNEEVIKLCQDFTQMDRDKEKLKQIQRKRLCNKVMKVDEDFKLWLKDLYKKVKIPQKYLEKVQQDEKHPQQSKIRLTETNIGYWQLNKLIDKYLIYEVFQDLRLNCSDKSQEQVQNIISKYLNTIESYTQMNQIVRIKQYTQKEQNKHIKIYTQEDKNVNINGKNDLRQSSIINCIVLKKKTQNIIQAFKNTNKEKLFIIEPNTQYFIEQNIINLHYDNQSQIILLINNLVNVNKILTFVNQKINKLIYRKCKQEKQMSQIELVTYFQQQEEFRLIVLLEQQFYTQIKCLSKFNQKYTNKNIPFQSKHPILYPQMIENYSNSNLIFNYQQNHQNQLNQQINHQNQINQQILNNHLNTKTFTTKRILSNLQTIDKSSIIINQYLQPKFYQF